MAKINILSPDVAALIAAGEVVERPSSVVKELCENSIDAGAKTITVEIKNGGISYLRVTDDGSGIAADDVPNAFLRHATSKISKSVDLESILTLGFRGEALHSIAAVSIMEMLTCTKDGEGTFARLEAGELLALNPAGCPVGTTITVRNLFYNTPARMKFLKKDATEAGYIEDILKRLALARPDISLKYINSGKEIFFTPGDNILKNAVYAIYGKDVATSMIEANYEENGVKVSGLIGKAELSRGNRSYQTFFVNGRCVINKSFYFALQEGYKNQMMQGRFPVAVLNIFVNPAMCDVNVHPSKAEIKFSDDSIIYGAVYWAAKNALFGVTEQRSMSFPQQKKAFDVPKQEVRQTAVSDVVPSDKAHETPKAEYPAEGEYKKPIWEKFNDMKSFSTPAVRAQENSFSSKPAPIGVQKIEPAVTVKKEEQKQIPDIKILGQMFETYIVAQVCDDMLLIDQHAAHERLIYNSLVKKSDSNAVSQVLLVPETIELSGSDFGIFLENQDFFEKYGFEADEFGHNTVRISAVPDSIVGQDITEAFCEMLEVLGNTREKTSDLKDKALYRMACRAALKAGQQLSLSEQRELILKILEEDGQVTCPHGRPVILKLTKTQIEKQFKRIV